MAGSICSNTSQTDAAPVSPQALQYLAELAAEDLSRVGHALPPDDRIKRESRGLLFGFVEYHLERRMRSVPMLVRTAP
jgi:hypothetical protein